jgi:xanthine dehydrogenase accessory factor
MKQLISEMAGLISRRESFAMATIITRNGSAPRSSGAKMLVRQNGTIAGTVGGGILEAQVVQLAMEVQRDHHSVVQGFQFTGKDANGCI